MLDKQHDHRDTNRLHTQNLVIPMLGRILTLLMAHASPVIGIVMILNGISSIPQDFSPGHTYLIPFPDF
jgi:hypothetical protein